MKINWNTLWAAGMGALGGAILYVTGRQDGQKEGAVVGYVAGAATVAGMAKQEQTEVKKDEANSDS